MEVAGAAARWGATGLRYAYPLAVGHSPGISPTDDISYIVRDADVDAIIARAANSGVPLWHIDDPRPDGSYNFLALNRT